MSDDESLAPHSMSAEERLLWISHAINVLAFVFTLYFANKLVEKQPALDGKQFVDFIDALVVGLFFGVAVFVAAVHVFLVSARRQLTRIESEVRCELLGNDEDAFRYVFNKCAMDRTLKTIYDTHMRISERPYRFPPDTYRHMEEGMTALLKRQHTHIECVFGRTIDQDYVDAMQRVDDSLSKLKIPSPAGFKTYELKADGPFANFMILKYENHSEVLFGWGRRALQHWEEAVFISNDKRLVNEFSTLHETMRDPRFSNEVPLSRIGKSASSATVLEVHNWGVGYIHDLLRTAGRGEDINIWTTYFVDEQEMYGIVEELLHKGVNVHILLMNPDNHSLVRSRFRQRRGSLPAESSKRISDQKIHFGRISAEFAKIRNLQEDERQNITASGQTADEKPSVGKLIVKPCDTMPFGSFYQVGNRIMVYGIFMPRDSWVQGPLVHVYPGGEQWNVLVDNWKLAWLPQTPPVDDDLIEGSAEDFDTENDFKDKTLHHYHLTQDSCGDCVWTYKVLTFRRELGRLVADSPIVANRDGDLSPYRFELSAHGKYVVLISSKVGVDPDVGVELLPGSGNFGEGVSQLYGARIIATFNHRKPVTTISILSKNSLTPGATPGFLDQISADELQKRWDANAVIGRLPSDCRTLLPKNEIISNHG